MEVATFINKQNTVKPKQGYNTSLQITLSWRITIRLGKLAIAYNVNITADYNFDLS